MLKSAKLIGKVPLRDGDAKAEYDGFEGNMYISARSKDRPTVFDNMRNPVVRGDPNAPYDGCYCNPKSASTPRQGQQRHRRSAPNRVCSLRLMATRFWSGEPADQEDFDEIGAPAEDDPLTA